MVAYSFNASQYDPSYGGGLSQLPPCKKTKVIICGSEFKPTKGGTGGYLQLILRVVEGPLLNKEGFDNLNLHNTNPKTVEIANGQLSAYCAVMGVPGFNATEALHNIPFLVDVDWQKGHEPSAEKPEGGYTQVTALYDVNGHAAGKAVKGAAPAAVVIPPAAVVAPPAVAAASEVPAWQQAPAAPAANGWAKN